jgi:hypothetical protein
MLDSEEVPFVPGTLLAHLVAASAGAAADCRPSTAEARSFRCQQRT